MFAAEASHDNLSKEIASLTKEGFFIHKLDPTEKGTFVIHFSKKKRTIEFDEEKKEAFTLKAKKVHWLRRLICC